MKYIRWKVINTFVEKSCIFFKTSDHAYPYVSGVPDHLKEPNAGPQNIPSGGPREEMNVWFNPPTILFRRYQGDDAFVLEFRIPVLDDIERKSVCRLDHHLHKLFLCFNVRQKRNGLVFMSNPNDAYILCIP